MKKDELGRDIYRVFVNADAGDFPDTWAYAAWYGFSNKTDKYTFFDVQKFSEKQLSTLPFGDDVIVVCGIDATRKYFAQNGIPDIAPFNIPDQLNKPEYLGRTLEVMTAEKFLATARPPIFVKPHSIVKQFLSGTFRNISTVAGEFEEKKVKPTDLVLTSTVIDFVSEYRCFISNGEIYDIRHYQGSCRVFPDVSVIDKMIKDFTDAPLAYTLDVGVVEEASYGVYQKLHKTYLVEAQDMWSIGEYGLDAKTYALLLHRRWQQIIKPYL